MRFSLSLSLSLALVSCEQEEVLSTPEAKTASLGNNPELISFTIQGANNETEIVKMLKFDSWEHFDQVAEQLSEQLEIYDDAFLAAHEELDEDQLEDLSEDIGYNDQVPQIDFESNLDFMNPLRLSFNIISDAYEESNLEGQSPFTAYVWSGSELSLINDRQQVAIGNEIYQTYNEGYISIDRDYVANLGLLAQNNITALEEKPGVKVKLATDPDCKGWKASRRFDEIDSGRRIEMVAKIRSVPFYSKQEKMSISYKKNRNGKFRQRRTHMSVNIETVVSFDQCNNGDANRSKGFNTYKKKRRRDIKTTVYGGGRAVAQNFSGIKGRHRHYTGQLPVYSLQW